MFTQTTPEFNDQIGGKKTTQKRPQKRRQNVNINKGSLYQRERKGKTRTDR